MNHVSIDDRKLGQYLRRTRKLDQATLDQALGIQAELPFLRLGEILLGLRVITFRDLTEALYSQFSEALFGHVIVRRKIATPEHVQQALERQVLEPQRRLGEILVEMGFATQVQVDEALAERELYNEYKFRLGFNRYFESEAEPQADHLAEEAALLDAPPGWAAEIQALDAPQPRWLPTEPS
ncbi:MAG TPA: hypothetical protein V6D05_10990 [Stenomitos sp.]